MFLSAVALGVAISRHGRFFSPYEEVVEIIESFALNVSQYTIMKLLPLIQYDYTEYIFHYKKKWR